MPIALPVLPTAGLRLTPTDVTQFVRAEQCERLLRFRLTDRHGIDFMTPAGVAPQRITPLLSLSGKEFEDDAEAELSRRFSAVNFAAKAKFSHNRPSNNADVVREAQQLAPGTTLVLFQTRLDAPLDGWQFRGDIDLLKLRRAADSTLHVLVTDLKATLEAKVEHRLQVTFYRLMLEAVFAAGGVPHAPIRTGVLFRPPIEPIPEEEAEAAPLREAARQVFGLTDRLLEVTAEPDAYARSARDLVLGPDSVARRIAAADFASLPFTLSDKCDGCLYAEFCLTDCAEREDLSLLPYLSGTEKEALRRNGVAAVHDLATLKDFAPDGKGGTTTALVPADGKADLVRRLSATWPVGPRLDELVHRAKAFRKFAKKGTAALPFIPDTGNSSLPQCRSDLNPNLVWVYADAQFDHREGRVYLLGALVVACENGQPARRRTVVHLTPGPPDSSARERDLFVAWTKDLLAAVVELAASGDPSQPKKSAPVHVVFFDRRTQTVLLEGLARNFPPVLAATPPLYDFLTQLAAFDSPISTFLADEVRATKNFPMTCQSLPSLATFLGFGWKTPHDFRALFRARLFDYAAQMTTADGTTAWYTKRARFGSTVPLEYAYAAWGQLPPVPAGRGDEFADFRPVTLDHLTAFAARRLDALEHVSRSVLGNPNTTKTPYALPDLTTFTDVARTLAQALHEFVFIERMVALADWKGTRHVQPERRVLQGECLLVRFVPEDQDPGIAEQCRENERRRVKREGYVAAFRAANPGKRLSLPKDQQAECKWSHEGMRLKLRVETAGVDCDLHEALLLSTLREGTVVVLFPRWTVDERKPAAERTAFTPTPKQMLYGQRAELVRVAATATDPATGRVTAAVVEVELLASRGSEHTTPFVFGAFDRPPLDGTLYTLDPCPNEWYSYWCAKVVEGLVGGQPNALYRRLVTPPPAGDGAGSPGQQRFLTGLDAFHAAGLLHDFEPGKREFIGGHAATPILLVQGPPGTGKSYSTAFAVFARLQGAMAAGRACRAFVTCKTHAATDVLLANVLAVQTKLRELEGANPTLFAALFDPRLLTVPLFRVAGRDDPPAGVTALGKDSEKESGEDRNADILLGERYAVVGVTPGGTYGMLKKKWPKQLFGHELCDLLVLDEASQMNLPEAVMAALPLAADAPVIVVGDHRQMPPVVKHDWEAETRRTFARYKAYDSLFDTLRGQALPPPVIRFQESFRLHAAMAEFLRREVYRHDGIDYRSANTAVLPAHPHADPFVAAVLAPDFPLVVVVHGECGSQVRNPFEQELIAPLVAALADPVTYGLTAEDGLGVVVPHRAQRAALQQAFPQLSVIDPATGLPGRSAIDTVERFQGGERTVVLVGATESDRGYLLASAGFLLDPRRLTVAVSRAKRKMVLVAGGGVFELFSPDEETFANAQLWKNLLADTCTTKLWEGERDGVPVTVWGGAVKASSGVK
jgi:hypothetical protein